MKYEIVYKITSAFVAHVDASTEDDAVLKFREIDMKHEVAENILDGSLDHEEIEIRAIRNPRRSLRENKR